MDSDFNSNELPPLIDLAVYRDTNCSQEMTDKILHHLWDEKPDLVAQA